MNTTDRNRIIRHALLIGLLVSLSRANSYAQFNSGSNGTNGAMNITTNTTLVLPPDGIFNCTTINVASNATLKFTPNALNTPVYLLATGDVAISGTIDVSGTDGTSGAGGAGGPGGYAGGNPGLSGTAAGDGCGPGAGRAPGGNAGYAVAGTPSGNSGGTYGSPLLVPLVGGSGSGGAVSGNGGAGGGGALLIASSTRIDVAGSIVASSPSCFCYRSFGSGGAVRLVAPVVAGSGNLNVNGGVNTADSYHPSGGAGRIRIDCLDRRSLGLTLTPGSSASIGSYMVVFPANAPRLDITQAAGNNIPVGTNTPVYFMLPPNSSTNQTVTVQASNFGAQVPIRVVLTPDNGPGSSYDTNINNTVTPASVTVPVVVPVNVQVQVNAWTR